MPHNNLFCGVDIGGSHISVGLVDALGNLLLVVDHQLLNNATVLADEIVAIIYDLIAQASYTLIDGDTLGKDGGDGNGDGNASGNDRDSYNSKRIGHISAVGIGCPGQCKNGVLIVSANLPLLANSDLAAKLSDQLDGIPVTLVNDADAAVAAEVWSKETSAEYAHFKNVAMITLGTGIGLGLVLNRALFHGSNGLIEGGHMIIPSVEMPGAFPVLEERQCGCGQSNCVEVYASAKSVTKRYNEAKLLGDPANNAPPPTGPVNAKYVFARAVKGDADAERIVDDAAKSLALMVVNICRVVDPDVVIFGGGMAQAGEALLHRVRVHVKALSWKILPTDVKIVQAKSPTEAGIIGAAMAGKHARGIEFKSKPGAMQTLQSWLPGVLSVTGIVVAGVLLWRGRKGLGV